MLRQSMCVFILVLSAAQSVAADEMTEAAQNLCEKAKSCAMAQVAEEDLTPELRQMMQPMWDSMCANMQSKVGKVPPGHPLSSSALACMRSMQKLTCEGMLGQQESTPECQAHEKLVAETQPAA
jgi:hypothetical protein